LAGKVDDGAAAHVHSEGGSEKVTRC
jgi:hypothetical protein